MQPDPASFAAVADGDAYAIAEALTGFRVPKHRYRRGTTYALARPEGYVLVDAVHEVTARALAEHLAGRPVLAVLITHADLLRQAFGPPPMLSRCFNGAPVVVHAADAVIPGTTSTEAAAELLDRLDLDVYHLPGHTPGSVAYRDRVHGYLFAGDAVVGRPFGDDPARQTASHPPIAADDYEAYVAAWRSVTDRVTTVLPLHGEPLLGGGALDEAVAAAADPARVMRA